MFYTQFLELSKHQEMQCLEKDLRALRGNPISQQLNGGEKRQKNISKNLFYST